MRHRLPETFGVHLPDDSQNLGLAVQYLG
jgi:hypothetical protein